MKRKSKTRKISRVALQLAEGLFAHAVDFGLWVTIYFAEMSVPQSQSGQLWRARVGADRFLNQVNYEVIKNAIQTARKRGWVKVVKRRASPEITKAGKERLSAVLPTYDEKRAWDGRMHLVTYDIPEEKKHDRELLRGYLRRLGCGMLQDSVWMTPYNPIDTLRSFISEHGLSGTIIISDIGKDGSVGEEDLHGFIVRVYKLEKLNERYEEWLEQADTFGRIDQQLLIFYLSILRDDPQLPFVLLPNWWKGDIAYNKVRDILTKVVDF
ncbi:CRISPR-associated endonuclease Cas2 [Patescibacteria group bacterium]|nr:CRISPR-associated endonuclease Cas2 [Patescibacteria group bacterium]MBU1473199.1 CRISPR-associated endonuclease Cas2 [Patescibacteria group bacterium]MBU2459751.1 CRISPR-associated endonuclease Cas2 [Patescibacteria group bacterium]MBU2544740.1 CRISPR-associated endonuclease Cas2 [Patescibacteria group bacterium]